jgi:hypothetical protein
MERLTMAQTAATAYLERGSSEWNKAWFILGIIEDFDLVRPHHGELWQYMGSERTDAGWQHVFRHRCHPSNSERKYHRVSASVTWKREMGDDDGIGHHRN